MFNVYNWQECAFTNFYFVDSLENNLFSDSISLGDFKVTAIRGSVAINSPYIYDDIQLFEVSLSQDISDNPGIALFEFEGYPSDTVVFTFVESKNRYYIETLYYNGELLEDNSFGDCGTQLHKIIK